MGFKCTSTIFSIWCTTIFLVCFSIQPILGFTCGEFGYNCINQRYYQKCDKEKNTRDIKVISVCPRDTICVQQRPNPCQPSKANTLEQIKLEQDQKLAIQPSEEKAAVKQILKAQMSDSAPLGNQDDSINNIKFPAKTPSSSVSGQAGNDLIEMKNLASTTVASVNTSTLPSAPSESTKPQTASHEEGEKFEKDKGKLTEHHTADEFKGDHEKGEHKEEGHDKSDHKEGHDKSEEHNEGHEKSEEHIEGHEKSGEHHGEEHKEGHEKTGEHKEGHEIAEDYKEGHGKSEEHKEEGHEKSGEHKDGHHGEEHKEGHKEESHKEADHVDSENEEHVKHDNAKEDQHAEHGNHEENTKHPEEHTTPVSNKHRFGTKTKQAFDCPHTGSFPDEESKECFYVCYRDRRSTNKDYKAIGVCCPHGMFFNSKTHKCTDCGKKTDKTKLSRQKRHRRWRRRG